MLVSNYSNISETQVFEIESINCTASWTEQKTAVMLINNTFTMKSLILAQDER